MRVIGTILDFLGTSQLTAFFLAGMLFHGGWQWLTGLILSIVLWVMYCWHGNITASIWNLHEMQKAYFERTAHFEFEEIDVVDLVPAALREALFYRKNFSNPIFRKQHDLPIEYKPIRAFIVKCSKPPYPAQLKAFVNTEGTSAVFLRDRPEGLSLIGRFKLYHELGHLTRNGARLAGEKFAVVARRSATLLVVAASYPRSIWTWILMLVFFFHQLYREKFIVAGGCEMDADSFAFEAIGDAESQKTLIEQLESLHEEDFLDDSDQKDSRLGQTVVRRLVLLNQKKNRLAKGKSLPPGITFTGIEDWSVAALFALLARHAPAPGIVPLGLLSVLIVLSLFSGLKAYSYLPTFERDIEKALPTPAVEAS